MTQTTHIAAMRAQYAYNRSQVLWLTEMTDEQLSTFQLDTGMDWLQCHTGEDRALCWELMKEPLIWKWWILHWYRRDDEFFLRALYHSPANERAARYRTLHQEVFMPQTPPYCLLENSYARVIGQVMDLKTEKNETTC